MAARRRVPVRFTGAKVRRIASATPQTWAVPLPRGLARVYLGAMTPHARSAFFPAHPLAGLLLLPVLVAALLLSGPARSDAAVVPVNLTARQAVVKVAPGVKMRAWTFNGSVPGPVVRVTEGDTIQINLTNSDQGTPARTVKKRVRVKVRKTFRNKRGKKRVRWVWKKKWKRVRIPGRPAQPHSIDFHAAEIAPDQAFRSIPPGATHTFSFVASRPGVYMYHCGTPMMLEHIAMGMYGAIIVDPAVPRPPAAKEITLVQSEFYGKVKNGWLEPDRMAMMDDHPAFVTFNGTANRYVTNPVQVPVGGPGDPPVRINFVNAGPNNFSAFHVVGTIFDEFQPDGHPGVSIDGVSTQTVAPGGGGVFELRFAEPGLYPFVSHSMRDMEKGAMGLFEAS